MWHVEIAEVWQEHYFKLFNCVNGGYVALESVDPSENTLIRSDDVVNAIRMLDNNKASGIDIKSQPNASNMQARKYALSWPCVLQDCWYMESFQSLSLLYS